MLTAAGCTECTSFLPPSNSLDSSAGSSLLPGTRGRHELEARAKELRRPAFVGVDVRLPVADDGPPGRRHRRQRQGVGRRAGVHQQHAHLALEDAGQLLLDAACPLVAAVGIWRHRRCRRARAARICGEAPAMLSLRKLVCSVDEAIRERPVKEWDQCAGSGDSGDQACSRPRSGHPAPSTAAGIQARG